MQIYFDALKSPRTVDDSTNGTTYIDYTDGTHAGQVEKITTASNVTNIRWTWCKWADRATATFDTDKNTPVELPEA